MIAPTLVLLLAAALALAPAAVSAALVSDTFTSAALSPVWRFENGAGDAGTTATADGSGAVLALAEGVEHDLWAPNTAAMLLQDLSGGPGNLGSGDVAVTVKWDTMPDLSEKFHDQGIVMLLGGDNERLLRAGVYTSGTSRATAFFMLQFGGARLISNIDLDNGLEAPSWQQVRVSGSTGTASFHVSYDGVSWQPAADRSFGRAQGFDAALVSSAGVYAGNPGTNPAHCAVADYFDVDGSILAAGGDTDAPVDGTCPDGGGGDPTPGPAPVVDFFYGPVLEFGARGLAQRWLNVLGSVTGAAGATATWSLDGGGAQPLALSDGNRRLLVDGDFNIELDSEALAPGDHTVTVTASAPGTAAASASVTVRVLGPGLPTPAREDFDEWDRRAASLVVDGRWDEASAQEAGYDRLLVAGSQEWDWDGLAVDAEASVGALSGTATGGLGLAVGWQGHEARGSDPVRLGWPAQILGWVRVRESRSAGTEFLAYAGAAGGLGGERVGPTGSFPSVPEGTRLHYRLTSARAPGDASGLCAVELRVWEAVPGAEAPAAPTLGPVSVPCRDGSVLLVAYNIFADWHYVETSAYAPPAPAACTLVGDEFDADGAPGAQWSFQDPNGQSSATVSGGSLLIDVPASASAFDHDLWDHPTRNGAPRLLQPTANGDVTVDVRFASRPTEDAQLQGVLLGESLGNVLRFGVYSGSGGSVNAFVGEIDDDASSIFNQRLPDDAVPPYLRVERVGSVFTYSTSLDGVNYTAHVSFFNGMVVNEAGVYGGVTRDARESGFTAEVDYFRVSCAPPEPALVTVTADCECDFVTGSSDGGRTVSIVFGQMVGACPGGR